jgi:D-hydroxyproline dehydrogenase subunit alpha
MPKPAPLLHLTFDGREVTAHPGQTVGAALTNAGIRSWRTTRTHGRPRGLFCGIGSCYDCLLTVDGLANQRACVVPAVEGMRLSSERGPLATAGPSMTSEGGGMSFEVAVVGGGPAGLAAATAAAEHGCRVVLIDTGAQLGGQYWRHPDESAPRGAESHGQHDWGLFTRLRERFERLRASGGITYHPATQVWFVESSSGAARTLHLVALAGVEPAAQPDRVSASTLILCPGGYDRQLPVPGWDLPGVMAAGGVQALLKEHRTLAGRRAIVAGTGPFLLPVAGQLLDAGADVVAVCEANRLRGWARHGWSVAGVPAKLLEGAGYAVALARHRVRYRTRTAVTCVDPDGSGARVGAVRLSRLDGRGHPVGELARVEVDLVALGWGFTPSLELIAAVGAQTRVDLDQSLVAVVDERQRSTVPGVYVAGEATGVGGALLAVAEGELAGLDAAGAGEGLDRLHRRIRRLRAFARAMHLAHPVPERWSDWLTDDTTICRCEEVGYAAVRQARDELGAADFRSVKLLARPGMGWCQGRVCGHATARLAAGRRPLTADDLRPIVKQSLCAPIPLARLADHVADAEARQ